MPDTQTDKESKQAENLRKQRENFESRLEDGKKTGYTETYTAGEQSEEAKKWREKMIKSTPVIQK